MRRRIGLVMSVALAFLMLGSQLHNQTEVVYANNGQVASQRQITYGNNRPLIDGDFYWESSRVREWLHSTSTNPAYTNKGTVTRRTRGFLSGFTTAERNQIAVTRRRTPIDSSHNSWGARSGGLLQSELLGSIRIHGVDGLPRMSPYSLRYQGHPTTKGDPMANNASGVSNRAASENETWLTTIVHDRVFLPTAWELQRYVESRGWSMARGNTNGSGGTDAGYWLGGTQTYTTHTSRGIYIDQNGRVNHSEMRDINRGFVPMLHLKPNAAAGSGKRIGDTLTFGTYNSDNPEGHSGRITWRVVNETPDGHKLIMAEDAMDHFGYNVAPGGNASNAIYMKSNHVNISGYDVDIVNNLLFQNTNASGSYITGRPEQPWFRVVNTTEFYRRNTVGARFRVQGRDVSGRSVDTVWAGGNFVRGAHIIDYNLTSNDPGGRDTVITIRNDRNIYMKGHLPFNMIDEPVDLDVKYSLPYNGYASNNQYVDVDVGLSNWNVNTVIPRWQGQITGNGSTGTFKPPTHTSYAGVRYRMRGRMRVTNWGGLRNALTSAQWTSTGLVHRTHSTVLSQPAHVREMYLTDISYNYPGDSGPSNSHGYDGSVGSVSNPLFMTWAQLRDAPGDGWVNFNTVMPIPQTWLDHGANIGFRAFPNITTNGHAWPTLEIENWTFELLDDNLFKLTSLHLPNGQTVSNPPVGSLYRHRITTTGNHAFRARDSRGYDWHATANIKIDKSEPTGAVTQNTSNPTNGNVTLTLDSRDDETGLSKVEYIGGGTVQSQNIPSINQSRYVQTNRSTFTVTQNGTYRFRLTDRVGNTREVTHTVGNIDRTPPTTSVTQTPTGWTNQDVTVNWTANAQGLSDLRRVRFDDGSGWSGWSNTSGRTEVFARTVSTNRTVQFQVEDVAGNVATRSHDVRNIDKDFPALTVSHQPNSWTNQNVITTIRAQDFGQDGRISGVRRLRMRPENGTWSGWQDYANETELSANWFEQTLTVTENGTYEVQVEDRAGNERSRLFTVDWIDRTAPEATVKLVPDSWTNQNVNMVISGQDLNNQGSRISGVDRIRLRRAGASSWMETMTINDSTESSPSFADRTFTVTDNGVYEFELRDRVGNTRIVRQTVDKIDRTPPNASGTFSPNGWTNRDITITWIGERTGNPGAPLRRYRTHNGTTWGSWQNASNPDRISVNQIVSSNGTYRFEVQDEAGNVASHHVVVTQYDNVAPVGNIRARFDRTEDEVVDGSVEDVNMIDRQRVTVDVFDVEDLGISGVEFIEIEEQRRTGSIDASSGSRVNTWQTVETYRYDWPDPYNVSAQTYQIDAAHALDTRFVLVVQDRAGNRSTHVGSNSVRHSVLQFKDFRITNVVNPALTQDEVDDLRNIDLNLDTVPVTAGTNVTFELTYRLRHLDRVEDVSGIVNVNVVNPDENNRVVHTTEIQMSDDITGHNQDRTITRTFRVPEGAKKGFAIEIDGHLVAEMENGTTHTITYPNTDSIGSVDNHLEEFFKFRIVK